MTKAIIAIIGSRYVQITKRVLFSSTLLAISSSVGMARSANKLIITPNTANIIAKIPNACGVSLLALPTTSGAIKPETELGVPDNSIVLVKSVVGGLSTFKPSLDSQIGDDPSGGPSMISEKRNMY